MSIYCLYTFVVTEMMFLIMYMVTVLALGQSS